MKIRKFFSNKFGFLTKEVIIILLSIIIALIAFFLYNNILTSQLP